METNIYNFDPDGERAARIDANAHVLLADSLLHIQQQAHKVIGDDSLASLIAQLRDGKRFSPYCFGLYYELALALISQDFDKAIALVPLLQDIQPVGAELKINAFNELSDDQAELYRKLLSGDEQASFAVLDPTPTQIADFKLRFDSAIRIMNKAVPELAAEFNALIREIYVVKGDPTAKYQFDGGSSYMLWGGLILNVESHSDDVSLIEVLAHESAHSLLFGFAQNETLVLNDDDDLFKSPLRDDPRPMDGIYHATYVSARMHRAMACLLKSDFLSTEQRQSCMTACESDVRNFWSGYEVVKQHALLTNTGRDVMQQAYLYMLNQ